MVHCHFFRIKKHLFDIKFYTLKQYNDFKESKIYKLLSQINLYTEQYNSPIGIELWLSSSKDFSEDEINRCTDKSIKYLATICRLHLLQKAKGFGSKIGILLGIIITHEDNYYILMDEYGNKWYENCCSKLEFIKE